MSGLPMIFDPHSHKWVPNPVYQPDNDDWKPGAEDFKSDTDNTSVLDPTLLDPKTPFDPNSLTDKAPGTPPALPFIDNQGRPIERSAITPGMLPPPSGRGHYDPLKIEQNWNEKDGPGKAFDTHTAVKYLMDHVNSCPTGYCQRAVWTALHAAGMEDLPRFGAAKEMYGYLKQHSDKFAAVASGLGNTYDAATSASYKPQIGDIMVYRGNDSERGGQTGPYGHIQMCVGFDKTSGKPIWMSDFATNPNNQSGLRDPVGHGGEFAIFRQHTTDAVVAQNNLTNTTPADKANPAHTTLAGTNGAANAQQKPAVKAPVAAMV